MARFIATSMSRPWFTGSSFRRNQKLATTIGTSKAVTGRCDCAVPVANSHGNNPATVRRLVLTKQEWRILLFVLMAFLLGLGTKIYRSHHLPAAQPTGATRHNEPRSPAARAGR